MLPFAGLAPGLGEIEPPEGGFIAANLSKRAEFGSAGGFGGSATIAGGATGGVGAAGGGGGGVGTEAATTGGAGVLGFALEGRGVQASSSNPLAIVVVGDLVA